MRNRPSIARCLAPFTIALVASVLCAQPSTGASSSTIVSATVPTATAVDVSGCASGMAGRTSFGIVLPAASVVTSQDCEVAFGSSNGLAQLRMHQTDRTGAAMWSYGSGSLDASFGSGGSTTVAYSGGAETENVTGVVIDGDGSIIAAGWCAVGGGNSQICTTRLAPDGSLDGSFGSGGRALQDAINVTDMANDALLAPDGRLYTAAKCGSAFTTRACVTRQNADGSLDTSWADNGVFLNDYSPTGNTSMLNSLALQPDGKLVLVGQATQTGTGTDILVARLNPDGSPDTSFNGTGHRLTAPTAASMTDSAIAAAIQPDGRIVVVGYCDGMTGCVLRYTADGQLDTSFGGGDGIVTTDVDVSYEMWQAVALQSDGMVLAAGSCAGGATIEDICVVRYESDGDLDPDFDGDGIARIAIAPGAGMDAGTSMVLQADGKVVVAGTCDMGGSTGLDFCAARLHADGTLDASFGSGGTVTHSPSPGANIDVANALAEVDGALVLAGGCTMPVTGADQCVVRLDRSGRIGQHGEGGVDWTPTPGTSSFAACLRDVSGGASAIWTATTTCPAANGAQWNDVAVSPEPIAQTTTVEPTPADATAHLRFGLRTADTQAAGAYVAPITFDVVPL